MRILLTILFAAMILAMVFVDSLISSISFRSVASETKNKRRELQMIEGEVFVQPEPVVVLESYVGAYEEAEHGVSLVKKKQSRKFKIFRITKRAREFDARVGAFLGDHAHCRVRFFMTWISPASSFRVRQLLVMESLFKVHPKACLIILSKELDSGPGRLILKPLLDRGYRVAALDPDLTSLFNNTPAEHWLNDIQSGRKDPGEIPLAQNLSNLMRLAALYKYGGVYLDSDFVVLRDLSGLRNAIGAQSIDRNGNWTRLNNAVLVFDKKHPLLYEFMKEFQRSFDGNKWGYNGPYLVSRVVERVRMKKGLLLYNNFTVLPPTAFYPVDWTRIDGFFKRPNDPAFSKWAKSNLLRLSRDRQTYGIHLWNRETGGVRIEEGSVIAKLISDHCIICQNIYTS